MRSRRTSRRPATVLDTRRDEIFSVYIGSYGEV